MTLLEKRSFADSLPDAPAKLVLAFGPPSACERIEQVLSAWPELTTYSSRSLGALLSSGPGIRQLIAYCETVSTVLVEQFKELKRDAPDLLIVAICESADRRTVRRLLDGGVDGFVFADQLDARLGPTVAAVFAGQMVVPRDMRDSLDRPSLSTRERQILAMVVMGLTNQEISARMFLAESTVKSHLSSAYNKLGVRSRSEAVTVIMDRPGSLGPGVTAPELRAA